MAPVRVSVVIPTHQPHPGRLARTLAGLAAQELPAGEWEIVVVDNASSPPLDAATLGSAATGVRPRLVAEPRPGLAHARRRGLREARGQFVVLVDDDNVLSPDYLSAVVDFFGRHPRVGALGGRSVAEYEQPPGDWWQPEFAGLLACRDLGPEPLVSAGLRPAGAVFNQYPLFAPIGAGMALRREAAEAWREAPAVPGLTDRRGGELTSGGDNDIVLTVMRAGWEVAYSPALSLVHLIPAARVQPDYLARLNRAIARSWIQVLRAHDACPWPPLAPWTVPLRQLRSWFAHRAWSGPAAHIRWQGACGHFEARAFPPSP